MLRLENFNASKSFEDFFKTEYEKLENRLGLKEKDIVLYVFGRVKDLRSVYADYYSIFRRGQSTIIFWKENKMLILVVEENWRKRGEKFWKGMFAESLCYSLLKEKTLIKSCNRLELLFYKTRKLTKIHEKLAEAKLYEYFDPILSDMITWRLKNLRDFSKAMLVRDEIGALTLLSFIYPAIMALPYARRGVKKAEKSVSMIMGYLPTILKKDIVKIFKKNPKCDDVLDGLYDFVNIAYLAST
ncbi:MAG: hypothetical protein DRJ38_08850 [Thermoprotei archaeon]|nr:MAG: hypothetical protein DRJ38_08850 [Thermoprotei archaeon]